MSTRPRKPVGAARRWRNGHARRLNQEIIDAAERALRLGVAENISARLRDRDIAVAELAASQGVNRVAAVQWTTGRELPSLRRLQTIAMALGCSLLDLLPDIRNINGGGS